MSDVRVIILLSVLGLSHDTVASILWSILGISILLAVYGFAARSSTALFVAAVMAFGFGILSIFSVGIFVLAIAMAQLIVGLHFRRTTRDNR